MALAIGLTALPAPAQPPAPAPPPATGLLVVDVKFAPDGTVAACAMVRSNLPFPLEATTVDYIKRKWVNEAFAHETVRLPITFDELPSYAKKWLDGLAPPPNFLPAGDPGRKMKLRVTFDPDGWVQHIAIQEPSGLANVDRETAYWVKVHWHDTAYQGQTLDAPFIFKTPAAPITPKPIAAKKPKPAPPPEPEAPAAVRVQ